jgi:replication factor A1
MFDLATSDVKEPVLQCLHIKPMQVGGSLERWRIVLSDGEYFVQSMLGAANKHLIIDGILKKNSVVKLKGWNSNKVSQKRCVPRRVTWWR